MSWTSFRTSPNAGPKSRSRRCSRHLDSVVVLLAVAIDCLSQSAHAAAPLNFLESYGRRSDAINQLMWALIAISLGVIAMTVVLLLMGMFHGRALPSSAIPGRAIVERIGGGMSWIVVGVAISTIVLFGAVVWTVVVLAATSDPPKGASVNIHVIGHQWWWEVRYEDDLPSRTFTTANEIHIPTNQVVKMNLDTTDVIHSFWVPALTGKTDLIPGQTNTTWLEANRAGVYRGQCTEFCGKQHAHMGFEVIAQAPNEFKNWWNHQLQGVDQAKTPAAVRDEHTFIAKCGICHEVRGTLAGGRLGPDLSHLMTRRTIAAATIPNTPGYLSSWIADSAARQAR